MLREQWAKAREEHEDYPTEKECRGCGQFKPLSDFTENLSYKDEPHSHYRTRQAKIRKEMKERWKKEQKKKKYYYSKGEKSSLIFYKIW